MFESFISLSNGLVVWVDREDVELVSQFTWRLHSGGYATTRHRGKTIYMHRLICATPFGVETDHANRNKLDNRRDNLRCATVSQNRANTARRCHNRTSRFKGVRRDIRNDLGRFHARARLNRKEIHIGTFKDEVSAAKAYNEWASKNFGEFANLNPV
jgi:hypothetical protein